MILYYATFLWCGIKTIDSASGSILYVKAENKEEAKGKIFDYIRRIYSVNSMGYEVMENPDKYAFSIEEETL